MASLSNLLKRAAGNKLLQKLLERRVRKSLLLMGIGSGDTVDSSGEKAVFKAVAQMSSQKPVCIFDVGANQGQYLNLILNAFSSHTCRIHCFEPSVRTFELLGKNCPVKENIFLNNCGLGKERGEATLFSNEDGSGLASLTKRELNHLDIHFNQSETVQIDTVDHYCITHEIDTIDLLKLDVEGHELDVLEGASHMFKNKKIDIVTFEFGGCNIDTRTYFKDFYNFFSRHKMNIFRITPSGYLFHLEEYKEIYEQFTTTNFVAIKLR